MRTESESREEILLEDLNPLIPWPHDQVPDLVHTCHIRLDRLVSLAGWEGAMLCPEVRHYIKKLSKYPDPEGT